VKACGLVVEYNPFHHGHIHHIQSARKVSDADCIVAIMSGSFLQRGEPAIMDKFHRTRAALRAGADLVLELPYIYAVQSSALFAKGAVRSLHEIGVQSLCFGSELGRIDPFIQTVEILQSTQTTYDTIVKAYLDKGLSYPQASERAYHAVGIDDIDMTQPNNILGLSYVQAMKQAQLPIEALTIKRIHNHYHDDAIHTAIASATSIRKELLLNGLTNRAKQSLPKSTAEELLQYAHLANQWHHWEAYFPFLHYKVMTMDTQQLATIHGVDEGLEHRLIQTSKKATSFYDWINRMKTKRYTQTRLQRMFVHILTNTTKTDVHQAISQATVPYLRLLGMNTTGREFLHKQKKQLNVPIVTNRKKNIPASFELDERATNVYYSILTPDRQQSLRKQEFTGPIIINDSTSEAW